MRQRTSAARQHHPTPLNEKDRPMSKTLEDLIADIDSEAGYLHRRMA